MDLGSWLRYIEACHPQTIAMGLERVGLVANRGNFAIFNCPVIMVAGTNGKGTTVAALAKLLMAAGLKVGTYTSPHLLHFNERVQCNAMPATDSELCDAFAKVETVRENTPLTFFEFTTLAAFYLLQSYQPDIVVLEVGLGGRLDAVNLVQAQLAIITSIGLDHEEYLGNTHEAIGFEKAGIIKQGIPVILGAQARTKSIFETIKRHQAKRYLPEADFEKIKLPDHFLPTNSVSLATAAYTVTARELGFKLPALDEIVSSLAKMRVAGRFYSVMRSGVEVILDVGHNPDASRWLAKQLDNYCQGRRVIAVWSSLADKDLAGIIEPLKKHISLWCVASLFGVSRAAPIQRLVQVLGDAGITQVVTSNCVATALQEALGRAGKNDLVLAFGSFYTVSQVYQNGSG